MHLHRLIYAPWRLSPLAGCDYGDRCAGGRRGEHQGEGTRGRERGVGIETRDEGRRGKGSRAQEEIRHHPFMRSPLTDRTSHPGIVAVACPVKTASPPQSQGKGLFRDGSVPFCSLVKHDQITKRLCNSIRTLRPLIDADTERLV